MIASVKKSVNRTARRSERATASVPLSGRVAEVARSIIRTGQPSAVPVLSMARQMKDLADSVVSMAGPAADLALQTVGTRIKDPKTRAAVYKGGSTLRRMRESAGMTVKDLATALNMKDPSFLEGVEGGKVAIPFELLLRVCAVIGRDDPIAAAMRLTRSTSPDLWKALDQIGFGRMVLQAGREREFAAIYRANDQARRLNDADFASVMEFTRTAFNMAVGFRRPNSGRASK